jgi:hypothetical protein
VNSVLDAVKDAGSASPRTGMPPVAGATIRRPPPRLDEHGPLVRSRGWEAFREA